MTCEHRKLNFFNSLTTCVLKSVIKETKKE